MVIVTRKKYFREGSSLIALALLLALTQTSFGCASSLYEQWANHDVEALLAEKNQSVIGIREKTAIYPDLMTDDEEDDEADSSGPQPTDSPVIRARPKVLSLRDALSQATDTSRTYLREQESLYLSALSLTGSRHTFSPRLAASLSHFLSDSKGRSRSQTSSATAGISQILPFGGSIDLTGRTNTDFFFSDVNPTTGAPDPDHRSPTDTALGISLTQPLLRGAGHEVSHESLTQSERNLVYAIRDFELFREDFAIEVATRYYDLVQQKQSIENTRANLVSNQVLRRQAEALFKVGRSPELDVLRARRNELRAENQLIASEEGFQDTLDQFKIFLGLSIDDNIDVTNASPEFISMDYLLESSLDVAFRNRLDYLNRKEQLEDSARSVRIARNNLLPDLNLTATYDLASIPEERVFRQRFSDETYTVGITLDIPLDRVLERNQYRSSQISFQRARRDLDLFRDNLTLGIRSAFRELERRKQSLEIQDEIIESERRNVRIAEIRFRQGDIPNRDVVEAQSSLLDARNGYISELVNYEISRLQLLRDLGILFSNENGYWKE